MSWAQGKTLHTSRTGRAKPRGKTTRKSLSVRKTKYAKGKGQDRPLGFDRMCHPQALVRTPLHPGCVSNASQHNIKHLLDSLDSLDFMTGVGLVRTSRNIGSDWLLVRRADSGEPLGFAQSHAALAYRNAAAHKGVVLECYNAI